ncbi:hypothetical protein D9758_005753 [Tetrapyrgos nigripes]|uniref:Late embryogenesis abundant protein LEA-2 subgroup domain-containing protein n=1 Tax=Tetrapyrgos nigripes TaxID=182062 RepID=A0A8H5GJE3_9AGAR|nr:hypothetical protein D9758_005753 [Tetrapyrgos nigripes]
MASNSPTESVPHLNDTNNVHLEPQWPSTSANTLVDQHNYSSKETQGSQSAAEVVPVVGNVESAEKRDVDVEKGRLPSESVQQYRQRQHEGLWTRVRIHIWLDIKIQLFLSTRLHLHWNQYIYGPSLVAEIGLDPFSQANVNATGVTIPLAIQVSIQNPNYVSAILNEVNVILSYPLELNDSTSTSNDTQFLIGNGTLPSPGSSSAITIQRNAVTNFTLPFSLHLSFDTQQNLEIIDDLLHRCGDLRNQTGLTISMEAQIKLHVLGIKVSSSGSGSKTSMTVPCPFTQTDLDNILQGFENGTQNIFGGGNGNGGRNPLTFPTPSASIFGLPFPSFSNPFPFPSVSLPNPSSNPFLPSAFPVAFPTPTTPAL